MPSLDDGIWLLTRRALSSNVGSNPTHPTNKNMKLHDRVKLVKLHQLMNQYLKRQLGIMGTIIAIGINDGKVLVQFDKSDKCYGSYWIKPDYLEKQ